MIDHAPTIDKTTDTGHTPFITGAGKGTTLIGQESHQQPQCDRSSNNYQETCIPLSIIPLQQLMISNHSHETLEGTPDMDTLHPHRYNSSYDLTPFSPEGTLAQLLY